MFRLRGTGTGPLGKVPALIRDDGSVLGNWRARWPRVGRWNDDFAARPSMRATAPVAA